MLHAMKEIKKLETEGERSKWLDGYFGIEDASRNAVLCLRCQDTGCAMIYHPSVVIAAAKNEEWPKWPKELAIRCNCEAGDKMPSQTRAQAARSAKHLDNKSYAHEKLPVFGDEAWHIATNDPDGKAKCFGFELQSVHEWKP